MPQFLVNRSKNIHFLGCFAWCSSTRSHVRQQTGVDMRCLHPLVMAFGATTGVTSAAKYAIMYTDGVVKQNEYKNAYLGAA